jgi:hypothetical protein
MKWAGHVARMGEERNAYSILVGKREGKRPLARPRRGWVNNIIFQHPVAFKYSLHSILQSLMQLFVHQFYTGTTCFGHIGPSSGTIAIVAKAVSL